MLRQKHIRTSCKKPRDCWRHAVLRSSTLVFQLTNTLIMERKMVLHRVMSLSKIPGELNNSTESIGFWWIFWTWDVCFSRLDIIKLNLSLNMFDRANSDSYWVCEFQTQTIQQSSKYTEKTILNMRESVRIIGIIKKSEKMLLKIMYRVNIKNVTNIFILGIFIHI